MTALLLVTVSLSELHFAAAHTLTVKHFPYVSVIFESKLTCLEWKILSVGDWKKIAMCKECEIKGVCNELGVGSDQLRHYATS